MPKKFLAVCLNPTIQKTLLFDDLKINEVNRARIVRTDASGKGVNVARILGQLGAEAIHLTHSGGPDGDWFRALCAADGISLRWVDSGSDVRFCTTVIDAKVGTATELVEESKPVRSGTEEALLELFDDVIREVDVLIVSGTKAAGYSDSVVPEMARRAAALGVMTVLDIKGKDLAACLPFRPAVVKPNLAEFLAGLPESGIGAAGQGLARTVQGPLGAGELSLRELAHASAVEWKKRYETELVLTRGGAPIWFEERGEAAEESIVPVQSLNPTGSGDAFTAGLAFALSGGASLREAVREGARLGALNAGCLKPGSIVRG
ncbi:MAG: PfkB family carbohydrate kinase [Spirochaetes bacterium]|nr:PfkB family carbohydrate kinase [Spirochaetota bacterium]